MKRRRKPRIERPGPRRSPGHRTKGLKKVVPLGAEIDRAARRNDRESVVRLMRESRKKLMKDMDTLNRLHNEASGQRRKQLMKQIRTTNSRLLELNYHLE